MGIVPDRSDFPPILWDAKTWDWNPELKESWDWEYVKLSVFYYWEFDVPKSSFVYWLILSIYFLINYVVCKAVFEVTGEIETPGEVGFG